MKSLLLVFLIIIQSVFIYSQIGDWSKQQLGTGLGNCGPASAAMLIERAGRHVTVEQARNVIGYRYASGATSFEELETILTRYNVVYRISNLQNYTRGAIIILLDMSLIQEKQHRYNGMHYVVIFGIIGQYYRVYDPLVHGEQRYLILSVRQAQVGTRVIWTI